MELSRLLYIIIDPTSELHVYYMVCVTEKPPHYPLSLEELSYLLVLELVSDKTNIICDLLRPWRI